MRDQHGLEISKMLDRKDQAGCAQHFEPGVVKCPTPNSAADDQTFLKKRRYDCGDDRGRKKCNMRGRKPTRMNAITKKPL